MPPVPCHAMSMHLQFRVCQKNISLTQQQNHSSQLTISSPVLTPSLHPSSLWLLLESTSTSLDSYSSFASQSFLAESNFAQFAPSQPGSVTWPHLAPSLHPPAAALIVGAAPVAVVVNVAVCHGRCYSCCCWCACCCRCRLYCSAAAVGGGVVVATATATTVVAALVAASPAAAAC